MVARGKTRSGAARHQISVPRRALFASEKGIYASAKRRADKHAGTVVAQRQPGKKSDYRRGNDADKRAQPLECHDTAQYPHRRGYTPAVCGRRHFRIIASR